MMIFKFIIILIIHSSLFADVISYRFSPDKDQSLNASQLKQHALEYGIKLFLEKEFKSSGHEPSLIWSKQRKRFNEQFKKFKTQKLTQKFGEGFETVAKDKAFEEFEREINLNEKVMYSQFLNLKQFVNSYSFKKFKQSSSPNTWQVDLDLNLRKDHLQSQLAKWLSDDFSNIPALYVDIQFENKGFDWHELNLTSSDLFITPLLQQYVSWLELNGSQKVSEVRICDEQCKTEITSWEKMGTSQLSNLSPLLADSLYLKIQLDVLRIMNDDTWDFQWSGGGVLKEINTKKLIFYEDFHQENWSTKLEKNDYKKLNSELAAKLLRAPLGFFTRTSKSIDDMAGMNQVMILGVRGYQNFFEAQDFMKKLKLQGAHLNLNTSLKKLSSEDLVLELHWKGKELALQNFLSSLKKMRLNRDYLVELNIKSKPWVFELKPK